MRVFVVPSWHPTPAKPHYCRWVVPHIELLRRHGFEACVLHLGVGDASGGNWGQPIQDLADRHLYCAVPGPVRRHQRLRWTYPGWLERFLARMEELFDEALRRWGRPDVIHAHVSLPAGFLAARLGQQHGVPVIVQEHYSGFESDARFPWRVGALVRELGKSVAGFYAVSPGYARRIEATGLIKVTGVLPNPIDTEFFNPGERSPLRPNDSEPIRLVTTGGVHWIKGSDLLLQAIAIISSCRPVHATIYGASGDLTAFRDLLCDSNIAPSITVAGAVNQATLRDAYRSSDLFVVSSRIETANVSMQEALACGTPVVTTACGAPETLVDGTVATIVKPNSAEALAQGILHEAQLPPGSRSIERLREFVQTRYSIPTVLRAVQAAYEAALQGGKHQEIRFLQADVASGPCC